MAYPAGMRSGIHIPAFSRASWRARALAAALALALAAVAAQPARAQAEVPVIAAASDLQFALEEVRQAFVIETGRTVRLAFGASGNLARQIRQGAPFEVFLSADETYVRALAGAGITRDDGAIYALGRLAILVARGSPLSADGSLADLRAALADGRVGKFAIANPAHAPYGRRAEEVLRHQGLWQAISPKLVLGENVSQAAQFAASGNAQGGLVAHSLALAPRLADHTAFALVPDQWHSPLRQRMVLLKGAGPVAEQFYDFLRQPAARAILERNGFAVPGVGG